MQCLVAGRLIGGISVSIVLSTNPRPMFKPREIKAPDVTHWFVEAEWADGTIDEIGQFGSISEAWGWIAQQSRAWTEDRCN
jgi:hypothetical protein